MAVLITGDLASEDQFKSALLDAMAARLSRALRLCAGPVRTRVGAVASAAISAAPEYQSLLAGELRGQLGVVSAEPVLRKVCRNIAKGVVVTPGGVRRVGDNVEGGLTVELLKGDYSEVLGAGGSFVSEGRYEIDWLRWLTLEGDRVIVADYHFAAGFPDRSRTGQGLMLPGGAWRVPPQYSGDEADNWLTRALLLIGPQVELILQDELTKHL